MLRVTVALACSLAATASAFDKSRLLDPRLLEFLGDNAVVVQESTSVELLRFADTGGPKSQRVAGFPLAFPPAPIRKDLGISLKRAVLDSHNYELASGGEASQSYRTCRFHPFLGFRFRGDGKKAKVADVLLSFTCNELGITLTGNQRAAALARAEEGAFGTADVRSGRNRFLAILRELLPDDPELKAVAPAPVLGRLREPLESALRVEAFRVKRLPNAADAHAHWKQIPRLAQAANLYEIEGAVVEQTDRFRRRAGKLLGDEKTWFVPLERVGEGLATHALRFVWMDPRRHVETSVDVLFGGAGQWVEIAELLDTGGARANRHLLDAHPYKAGAMRELLREAFAGDEEFDEEGPLPE